jgi:hypothetical protein
MNFSLAGGWVGAIAGMIIFWHKVKKSPFLLSYAFIVCLHLYIDSHYIGFFCGQNPLIKDLMKKIINKCIANQKMHD